MSEKNNSPTSYLSSLTDHEREEIEAKINYELELSNYHTLKKMTLTGILTNALAGFFVICILYQQTNHVLLLSWYGVLIGFNIINVLWSMFFKYRYHELTPGLLKKWHNGLYFILAGLCLTWGSIGILFTSHNPFYQLFVITFLQIAVLSFSFGSLFDFLLALICIICLLLPTIIYELYQVLQYVEAFNHDNFLNLAFAISLLILGGYLLLVCFVGYRLILNQATLGFLNAALNEKLDSLNKFLEQRVKERTAELENSLKLVTYQATHDLLTDLPNQRLLLEYLEKEMQLAQQHHYSVAVLYFYINEIERINDGLGYKVGDFVIKTVAHRLQRFANKIKMSQGDAEKTQFTITLSRKDVFVILLHPLYKIEECEFYAEQLFSVLEKAIRTKKQSIKLTGSLGVSIYPRDGVEMKTLLMNADLAMLRAKQRGGNSLSIYHEGIHANISGQLEMESFLHAALGKEEFNVLYQPFIDLKSGHICGAEVLVRWENPALGRISPADFIPLAEANGIILPLGEWVLRTACKQAKLWHKMGFSSLKVAVNLSAKQLQQKNIIQIITEILAQSTLDPAFLELELTESTAFQTDTIPLLKEIKALGLSLAIDDFGTGYSGLSNLKLVAINKLKIDQSFVKDITSNNHSKTIISNTIAMAKKLNIKVLAEGVETKEQLALLQEYGCDMIQGYYFSRPISSDAFTALLEKRTPFIVCH